VTTVVGRKDMVFNEVELNSIVLLCGATTFYRRLAYAKPALSRRQAGTKPVTASKSLWPNNCPPPFLSNCP